MIWSGPACQLRGRLLLVLVAGSPSAPVPDALSGVVRISAGNGHTCAVKDTGTVQCWGESMDWPGSLITSASHIQARCVFLFFSGAGIYPFPSLPANLTNVTSIAIGDMHACALKSDGTIACFCEP